MEQEQKKKAVNAHLQIALAIADAIKELREVPSGHLYARLMGNMDIDRYNMYIGMLKNAGFVREDGFHMLYWIGK
jgi:hypothetical protein